MSDAAEAEEAEALAASFFPCARAPPPVVGRSRCLLVGAAGTGKTSLLLQLALNRARLGLCTLFVSCGPPLDTRPPARPRVVSESDEASEDVDHLLRRIYIKHCATWPQLRETLASLHLPAAVPSFAADGPPRGLIVDGLSALFASRGAAAGRNDLSQSAPSPSKPEQQRTSMFLALALALAAHAADHLDAAAAAEAAAAGAAAASSPVDVASTEPPAPCEPALLVVSCSAPAPEAELAGRWLPTVLRTAPTGRQQGTFTLRCRQGAPGADEAALTYRFEPGKRLERMRGPAEHLALLPPNVGPFSPRGAAASQGRESDVVRTPARALPVAAPPSSGESQPQPPLASAVY